METFELLAQKKKRKTNRQIVGISTTVVLGFVAIFLAARFVVNQLLAQNYAKLADYYQTRFIISYPNIYMQTATTPSGQLSTDYHIERYKDIDGVSVPYLPIHAAASFFDYHLDRSNDMYDGNSIYRQSDHMVYSNKGMYRTPVFFNAHSKGWQEKFSPKPSQELPLTKEMPNQLVEVALTFDKPYSYEELQEMLPTNLKKNWYWFGTQNTEIDFAFSLKHLYGIRFQQKSKEEDYELFYSKLNSALRGPINDQSHMVYGSTGKTFSNYNDMKFIKEHYPTLSTARFSGVILTGKAEYFAPLEDKEWIFASSIGTSISNQPYYQLDVE